MLKDTTQWRRWGSNPRPFGIKSSTLPLSNCSLLSIGSVRPHGCSGLTDLSMSWLIANHTICLLSCAYTWFKQEQIRPKVSKQPQLIEWDFPVFLGWTSTKQWIRYLDNTYIYDKYVLKYQNKYNYSKTCLKRPLSKRPKIGFKDQLVLNAGQKYCRMLQGVHSAILSTFI